MKNSQSIKNRIRNAFVIANGMRKKLRGESVGKRIIAIHDVKDTARFRDKMQWLREEYEILSIERLLTAGTNKKTQLAITFDDGYYSWHENVVPVLEELNIPATFFICSGFVGLKGQEARDFVFRSLRRTQKLYPLEKEHIKSISSNELFEVGGHTAHHIDLGKKHEREVLADEILGDMKRLEDWSDTRVRWFAYPFGGKCNICEQSKNFIKNSGYEAAFTIIPGFARATDDRYEIGRDSLNLDASDLLWKNWINGGYDKIRKEKK